MIDSSDFGILLTLYFTHAFTKTSINFFATLTLANVSKLTHPRQRNTGPIEDLNNLC